MALDDLLMSIFVTYPLHICFLHPYKFSFLAYYTYYLLRYIYTIIFTTDGDAEFIHWWTLSGIGIHGRCWKYLVDYWI